MKQIVFLIAILSSLIVPMSALAKGQSHHHDKSMPAVSQQHDTNQHSEAAENKSDEE